MTLSRVEGIVPALESSHAVAWAMREAPKLPKETMIVVNLSGRETKIRIMWQKNLSFKPTKHKKRSLNIDRFLFHRRNLYLVKVHYFLIKTKYSDFKL